MGGTPPGGGVGGGKYKGGPAAIRIVGLVNLAWHGESFHD